MIWILPGTIAVVVAVPVVVSLRRCLADVAALQRSLAGLTDLAPSVRQLQREASALASEVPVALRRRSVVAPSPPALPSGPA